MTSPMIPSPNRITSYNRSIMSPTTLLLISLAAAVLLAGMVFVHTSLLEKEPKAAWRGAISSVAAAGIFLFSTLLPHRWQTITLWGVIGITTLGIILFFLPGKKPSLEKNLPPVQVDEREVIFARARLEPGSENYQSYYRDHPEHQQPDDAARIQPGLLNPAARFTDPTHSAAAAGSFFLTDSMREAVDGDVSDQRFASSDLELTIMVKKLARYYGALDCGIAELQPAHIYSHIGRGSGRYGDPIHLEHPFGIVFTVEMDFEMTGSAPYAPVTMESGRQYVETARVAVQLAAAIRELGYPARAHIDGNYRVIAPLVARDAGLGEIGRMGLLMTPRLGPRVRVGVVTTSMPLVADEYISDLSTLDFCQICKKCADNCPSQAIPYGERAISSGVLRWKISAESCYHYWTVVGTDCGRCMAVCPYSHPDHWVHNLVRWGIRRSWAFRRAALFLDDFFYGRKPGSRSRTFLPG